MKNPTIYKNNHIQIVNKNMEVKTSSNSKKVEQVSSQKPRLESSSNSNLIVETAITKRVLSADLIIINLGKTTDLLQVEKKLLQARNQQQPICVKIAEDFERKKFQEMNESLKSQELKGLKIASVVFSLKVDFYVNYNSVLNFLDRCRSSLEELTLGEVNLENSPLFKGTFPLLKKITIRTICSGFIMEGIFPVLTEMKIETVASNEITSNFIVRKEFQFAPNGQIIIQEANGIISVPDFLEVERAGNKPLPVPPPKKSNLIEDEKKNLKTKTENKIEENPSIDSSLKEGEKKTGRDIENISGEKEKEPMATTSTSEKVGPIVVKEGNSLYKLMYVMIAVTIVLVAIYIRSSLPSTTRKD